MKRFIFVSLIISAIIGIYGTSYGASNYTSLSDINGTSYEEAINELINLKVVSGYPDNTFKPENTVTRAEIAKMLVIANGYENEASSNKNKSNFTDVETNHWANGYINTAYLYGYIEGYPDDTFKPDDKVSYAEAITMTIRMLGYGKIVDESGNWPDNYITRAKNLKILNNVTYTKENEYATRGNIAQIIWNSLKTTKSYYLAGILEEVNDNMLGEYDLKIDGNTYNYKKANNKNIEIEKYEDGVLFYLLKKNINMEEAYYESGLALDEIFGDADDYVEEVSGNIVLFSIRGVENFADKFKRDYKNYVFINITIDEEEREVLSVDSTISMSKVTSSNFKEDDRIFVDKDAKVLYIVSGFESESK